MATTNSLKVLSLGLFLAVLLSTSWIAGAQTETVDYTFNCTEFSATVRNTSYPYIGLKVDLFPATDGPAPEYFSELIPVVRGSASGRVTYPVINRDDPVFIAVFGLTGDEFHDMEPPTLFYTVTHCGSGNSTAGTAVSSEGICAETGSMGMYGGWTTPPAIGEYVQITRAEMNGGVKFYTDYHDSVWGGVVFVDAYHPLLETAENDRWGRILTCRGEGWIRLSYAERFTGSEQPSRTSNEVTCPGVVAPIVSSNSRARVTLGGTANRVRSEPNVSARQVTSLAPGEEFSISGGSVCADGYRWWPVVTSDGSRGWTVDGDGEEHWIEPAPPNR